MKEHRNDEPFFITEDIEAELAATGYAFEPPAHVSTLRLRDVLARFSDYELTKWPDEMARQEAESRLREG